MFCNANTIGMSFIFLLITATYKNYYAKGHTFKHVGSYVQKLPKSSLKADVLLFLGMQGISQDKIEKKKSDSPPNTYDFQITLYM